jgi:glycosyltransferase involved in cell wall biosynthesis
MRVGINCLNNHPGFVGGVNTFTCGLLHGLAARRNGHRFSLYATSRNQYLFDSLKGLNGFEIIVLDDADRVLRDSLCRAALLSHSEKVYEFASNTILRRVRETIEADVDVTYTPSTVLRYFNHGKPAILSMHDIQHVHYPEFFGWARKLSRRVTYELSARHATFLQASTEFIKRDLLRHFHFLQEQQVVVIPEGVCIKDFAAPSDTACVCRKYRLPERFLLYPAQPWPHKNHMTLLRALKGIEQACRQRIPLVLTGGKVTAAPGVAAFIAEKSMDYIFDLGQVPFADLVALYQKASFLVMPSLHESSSLPILEAAAAGAPIIASKIPPCEELACRLDMNLFPPLDVVALGGLIRALWDDEKTASAQARHNREAIKAYSWENAAEKFLNLCAVANA